MADKLVPVRFLNSTYPPYIKGDIAGFEPKVAKMLIASKTAEAYKVAKPRVINEEVISSKTKRSPKNKMASSPKVK